jgi:hypothetical protein
MISDATGLGIVAVESNLLQIVEAIYRATRTMFTQIEKGTSNIANPFHPIFFTHNLFELMILV